MKKFIIFCSFIFLYLPSFAVQEVNSFLTLKSAVIAVNNHEDNAIQLIRNISIGPSATPLIVTTNTVLTSTPGSTFTITGNSTTSPILTFQGAGSTITNINFSSSTATDSAIAINVAPVLAGHNYSTFTISEVTFSDNTSSSSIGGGALNIVSGQATHIVNTTFSTNTATAGNGGAFYYQGNIALIGEEINANNNIAQLDGGAIYASSITLTSSVFSTNTATTGNGGAIYVSSGTVTDSEFYYNTAGQDGGAIYASTLTLSGSKISTNTATGNGGAIYVTNGNLQNSDFSYNIAGQDGGAIYASTMTITEGMFSTNTATGNGGAIYLTEGNISGAKFFNNTAQNGGAIYASTVTLNGGTFSGNIATTGNGGAIYVTNRAVINNITFNGNMATSGDGGAIYITDSSIIKDTSFVNNTATAGNGGAIYNDGLWTTVQGGVFNGNQAINGGAVYSPNIMHFTQTNFSQNSASGNGGALYVGNLTTVTINGSSSLTNNTAGGLGGAIYVDSGSLGLNTMGGTLTFRGNRDSNGDNDIYLAGSSIMSIESDIDHQGTVNFYGGVKGSGSTIVAMSTNVNWYTTEGFDGEFRIMGGGLNLLSPNAINFGTIKLTDSARLSTQNNTIDTFGPSTLELTGDIPLYVDIDLANNDVDTISTSITGTGRFVINDARQLRILSDALNDAELYTITTGNNLSVNTSELFAGPLYLYNLQPATGGFRVMQTNRLNPTVSALPVAANSKVIANINTVNSLYNRIDVMLSREYLDYYDKLHLQDDINIKRVEEEMARLTGDTLGKKREKLLWFIPNGGYQKVDYGNDVNEVKNIFYGGLVGMDYPFWISDDAAFIPTLFAGYLGATQKYEETTLHNNSLAAGGMLTFRKAFTVLSAQAYVTNGEESYEYKYNKGYFDVFSVAAALKGEFNLNLTEHIVLQPAFTAIYNYSSLQNYLTANLARMYSTRYHNFVLTPSLKLMASCNGWYPYVGASYNISNNQKGRAIANDLVLPEYKIKNFGEVSVGIENTFFKDYSGYVQLSAYIGSSKGAALQMGLRTYLD